MKTRLHTGIPLGITLFGLVTALLYLPATQFVDEFDHWSQAQVFARGEWSVAPNLATWPTMNAIVGWLVAVTGQAGNLVAGRTVIAAFGILAIAGFFRVASEFDPRSAGLRTAQFFLSPAVLPFCVLVYTDIPALSCLLWGALGALRRDSLLMLAGVAAATAFRQNDIVWLPALFGLYSWLVHQDGKRVTHFSLIGAIAVGLAWLAVVWIRGGVASGTDSRGVHPGHLRGLTNVWFLLLVAGISYAPYFMERAWAERRLRAGVFPVLFLTLVIGGTFHADHPFNLIYVDYFLRNSLLRWIVSGGGLAIVVPWIAFLGLIVWRTPIPRYSALMPPFFLVASVALLPFWLIEQRYYLPILAFFWTMRGPARPATEYAQLAFGLAGTVWIVSEIAAHRHFL